MKPLAIRIGRVELLRPSRVAAAAHGSSAVRRDRWALSGPLAIVILSGVLLVSCAVARDNPHDLDAFWIDFRAAVLASDIDRVRALTRWPFETRGESDDDTVVAHDEASFAALYPRIVTIPVYTPTSTGFTEQTMREFIEAHPTLPANARLSDTFTRLGEFEFAREGQRWHFVRAYLSE